MVVKRVLVAAGLTITLAACGAGSVSTDANQAAATAAARLGDFGNIGSTAEAMANDPTAQALVGEVSATIEAVTNDPTAQAALATADAVLNDPTTQAAVATADAALNDPTTQAALNDPTAQAAMATAQAAMDDPTAQAAMAEAMATAQAALNDPALQAELDQAMQEVGDQITLAQGESLTFDDLAALQDISGYKMTLVEAPSGASATTGTVIKEASDGNISLNPDDYSQVFTVPGDYTIQLEVTSNGQTATHDLTITVP